MPERKAKTEIDLHAVLRLLYGAMTIGITLLMGIKEIWPYTLFVSLHADSQNMYPSKLVFMETFISVLTALYPVYRIVKKIVPESIEKDED